MRLSVIPKTQLSAPQLREATLRISAPEHAYDVGPRYFWNRPEHDHRHFALFDAESGEFVGTAYCVIMPPVVQDLTWWFDSRMRKKGYWRALADDLASYLKRKHAITTLGYIVFGNQHRVASQKIAQRMRGHFEKQAPSGKPGADGTG